MKHKGFAQAVFGLMVVAAMILSTLTPIGAQPSQTTVTLTPVADATINSFSPSTNFGHENTLKVQYHSPRLMERSLIRFNLAASVPSDAIIDLARLELFLDGRQEPVSINLLASRLTTDWVEGHVTWNNPPATGSPTVATLVDTSVSPVRLDVTDIVRAWHNVPHYGLEVRGPEGETVYDLSFESREHGEMPPRLVVTYHLPTTPIEGWCCLDGEVFAASEAVCLEMGGHFFATQEEADHYCRYEEPTEGPQEQAPLHNYPLGCDTPYHERSNQLRRTPPADPTQYDRPKISASKLYRPGPAPECQGPGGLPGPDPRFALFVYYRPPQVNP